MEQWVVQNEGRRHRFFTSSKDLAFNFARLWCFELRHAPTKQVRWRKGQNQNLDFNARNGTIGTVDACVECDTRGYHSFILACLQLSLLLEPMLTRGVVVWRGFPTRVVVVWQALFSELWMAHQSVADAFSFRHDDGRRLPFVCQVTCRTPPP